MDVGLRSRGKVDVVELVAGVAISGDGDILFDQYEMVFAEGSSEAVVAELPDGDECSILRSKESVGAAGGEREQGGREQCGMRCLHIGVIGQAEEDAIRGGDFVGAGSVGAKEMACATGVGDGSSLWGGN